MSALQLVTLGDLQLSRGVTLLLAGHRKELALLAYLARRSPRVVPRAELAALLWDEREEERSRHSLRQALLGLRNAVGDGLVVTATSVRLDEAAVTIDARCFEQEIGSARDADAVQRWQGDFLNGLDGLGGESYRGWLEQERESLRRQLDRAFDRLFEAAATRADWVEATRLAERWVEALPDRERPHARLVVALRQSGRHPEAAAHHAAGLARLRGDLGIEPSAEFVQLGQELDRPSRAAPRNTQAPGSSALLTPDLIGRAAALATLQSLWQQVYASSAMVLIEGEEGVGKSRLASEFVRRVRERAEPLLLLEAHAEDQSREISWSLARRLFEPLSSTPGLDDAPNPAVQQLTAVLPVLRDRFSHLQSGDPAVETVGEAMGTVLESLSRAAPVLIVVDDVMRADAASLGVLQALSRRRPRGTLIILTARTEELVGSATFSAPRLAGTVRRLTLQALSLAETEALIATMLELSRDERSMLAARVHEETAGNPYYTSELLFMMADAGLLLLGPDGIWRVSADIADRTLPLPGDVRGATAARLAHLSPGARGALDAAAVLGARSDPALLQEVAQLTDADFDAALDQLLARRLLRRSGDQSNTLDLSNALLRRAVYDLIPPARCQALHAAAFRALAGVPGGDALSQLARRHHRARAGRLLRSKRTWPLVGAALGLVVLVAVGGMVSRNTRASTRAADRRVLVVPFSNQSGHAALDALGSIAADWISQGIARTGLLNVVPVSTTDRQPDRSASSSAEMERSAGQAARALAGQAQAGIVVWGTLTASGDSLRAQVRIVDARSGELLRAVPAIMAPLSRPMASIEPLRQQTLAALAALVDPRMSAWARVASTPPSYDAYVAFAEGLDAYNARSNDRPADPFFLRAYTLDTTFTLPLLYIALRNSESGNFLIADSLIRRLQPRQAELAPFDRNLLEYMAALLRGDWPAQLAAARSAADIAPQSLIAAVQLPDAAIAVNRPRLGARAASAH